LSWEVGQLGPRDAKFELKNGAPEKSGTQVAGNLKKNLIGPAGIVGSYEEGVYFMTSRKPWMVVVLVPSLTWIGCSQPSETPAAPPKPPEVTVAPPVERSVIDYDEFTGRMASPQNVEIRARVRGYLDAVHFTDGQEVKAGTLLMEIDPRTFDAELKNTEGQKAQWLAKRDKAQADVTRYEGLVPTGAASAQDLDKSRAELGEAIAAIKSADAQIERAKLDVEFARITAPIDGQLSRALITKGNLVQSGSGDDALLTTMVSLDPMYVYFDVDERAILRFRERHRSKLQQGEAMPSVAQLKIPITMALANDEEFHHSGVIDFADNRVDPSTGTVQVRGTFDNSKRQYKPGFFARIRVPISDAYQAVLVADSALGTDQGKKYVLVVDDQNVVERRFVVPGPLQDDGLRVISDGLKSGERVVINGIQRARPGKPVTPQRGEMPLFKTGVDVAPSTTPAAPAQGAGADQADTGH